MGHSLKAVIFSPVRFFRTTTAQGGVKEPLSFGALAGSLGIMFEIFWQGLIRFEELPSLADAPFGAMIWGPLMAGIMLLSPVIVTVFICLSSFVLHLLLKVLRAGKGGFEATLRVVSYSQATQVWAAIPFVGSVIAGLWLVGVVVIGLREIHRTSYARVIFAFMIPFLAAVALVTAGMVSFLISL